MAIKFKAVRTINPSNVAAPRQYYVRVIVSNNMILCKLSKKILKGYSLYKNSVHSLLENLMETLSHHLSKDFWAKPGDFMTLRVKLGTKLQVTEELATNHVAKEVKINFHPNQTLCQAMANTPLVKAS